MACMKVRASHWAEHKKKADAWAEWGARGERRDCEDEVDDLCGRTIGNLWGWGWELSGDRLWCGYVSESVH